ncbi:vWA domain-containing protein [Planococcus ruber]|uniref:vWA domain-containing protein n=1 Tax=Planococcus ruber TaxID=2027871 RepID=UPI001FEF9A5D|nr:BatA and WFA domain-containing protein [Planococcus ruber]MCJ1907093.1 BatA and WFA domain-containing protein [Planococcus ruber]
MGIANWIWIWTAIMPLAVFLYYFFRKKYQNKNVSSVLFWQEMMKEIQASPYLKKLQHHLLFYLQMAALLLCVFGLIEPYWESETVQGNELIFIVDTSASMLAGSPSRFDQQKTAMAELVGQAGGKPVTVIKTGQTPEVAVREERDQKKLLASIENLEVNYEEAQMDQTILFAESLVKDESTVIHIFTDAFAREALASKTEQSFVVHSSSEKLANASIRQFGLSQSEKGLRAIVQVVNESEEQMKGTVTLSAGGVSKEAELELQAGEERLVPFENLPAEDLWTAEIQVNDDYAADNRMLSFVQQESTGVVVDSSLHSLVSKGFESIGMEVAAADPSQFKDRTGSMLATNQTELFDLNSPILLIGRNDAEAAEVSGAIETTSHPLFTYADLENVYVSALYPGFDAYETIAEIDGKPFIQLSPKGDIAILSDIQSTNWPLDPSFPLFLWSAANELTGSEAFLGYFQPNEHRSVPLASDAGEWELFKGKEYVGSYLEGEGPFIAPAEPGVYEVNGDGRSMQMIVQLSSEEKTLASGASYAIGQASEEDETIHYPLIPWAIAIVLLLLLVEWEVYRRGIAIR